MNEVAKLYENAGVEKKEKGYCDCDYIDCPYPEIDPCSKECPYWIDKGIDYPLFIAEKQLHLIKWLSDKADYIDIHYDQYKGLFIIQTGMGGLYVCNEFEQALASRVNIIWQDLTEEECKQVKNILESEVRE